MLRITVTALLLLAFTVSGFSQTVTTDTMCHVDGELMTVLPEVNPQSSTINGASTAGTGRAVDIVGGTNNSSTKTGLAKGNSYRVDIDVTLTEAEFWLNFSTLQTLNFYVYESPVEFGTYNQIFTSTKNVTGTGAGWYSSDSISVALNAGNHYIIAVSFSGTTTYYYNTGDSELTSFGSYVHGYATGTHPLPPTITSMVNDQAIYHQRLTTQPGGPALAVNITTISEAQGGRATFTLNAGVANGNRNYILLGSVSGTTPGIKLPGGIVILPLNFDIFTLLTITLANTPPFMNFQSTLDGAGMSWAVFDTLGPIPGTLGLTFTFAYACNAPWDFVSNPVHINVVP